MSAPTQRLLCPRCQAEIGVLVDCGGVALLRMGGGLCRQWAGVCAQCGRGLYWSVSEQMLARILEHLKQDQK